MKTLYLIRGLPGSGKSTLAASLKNTRHFEADRFFVDERGDYNWDGSKIRDAHKWCQYQVEIAMTPCDNVDIWYDIAVSNTFTMQWEMRPYFDLAEKYGWNPFVIHCENNFGNIHGVGVGIIDNMKRRWEAML